MDASLQTERSILLFVLKKQAHLQVRVCLTARVACTLLPSTGLWMTGFKSSIRNAMACSKALHLTFQQHNRHNCC